MGDVAGTIRNVKLNGTSFDAMADANITANDNKEKEGIPTSTRNMIKITKKVPTREGVDLAANPAEVTVLKGYSSLTTAFPMSVTYADGSIYRADGHINFEGHESESNKATIIMIPIGDWVEFVAP